jgi:hypothetical protein
MRAITCRPPAIFTLKGYPMWKDLALTVLAVVVGVKLAARLPF